MITEQGKTVHWRYDPDENIVFVSFPDVKLESAADIVAHFDQSIAFWERHCGGRKVYWLVNYHGLNADPRHTKLYSRQLERVNETAITTVRYGGSSLQRTAVRLASMKLHMPSHLYASLEEALDVIRKLKSGEMQLASSA